ncbi:hypothetical protein GCM10008905_19670 [Clostridium malenominatum]|uniref:Uncharacterized protein n=1 Tax=Clostridium malenominatum TaxID=1539 RepID=A0ABN1J0G4_9CLOT
MTNESIKLFDAPENIEEILKSAKDLPEVKIVQTQQTNGQIQCGLITFEGLGGNFLPIPPQNLGFTIATFETGWFTDLEVAAGGTAPFNNLPSPVTLAGFTLANDKDIFLSNPVSSVSLFYSSFVNVAIEAYDINNNLLQFVGGLANYVAPPNTIWNQLTINLGSNVISTIRVIGGNFQTAIDNIQLCVAPARGLYVTSL